MGRLRHATLLLGLLAPFSARPALAGDWERLACFALPGSMTIAVEASVGAEVGAPRIRIETGSSEVRCYDASARTAEEIGAALEAVGVRVAGRWSGVDRGRLILVRGVRRGDAEALGRVLAGAGRSAVVELAPERSLEEAYSSSLRPTVEGAHPPACGTSRRRSGTSSSWRDPRSPHRPDP